MKNSATAGPIPAWAWLFAVACILIPIVSLGGAIPGAIGAGSAFACVAVARNHQMSTAARIGTCCAIAGGAWIVFIILVTFVFAARS
jgi:hypothetical protein